MRADRFKLRYVDRRRRRICVKCGEAPARPRKCSCVGCAVVQSVKDRQRREGSRKINLAIHRAAILRRLEILDAEAKRLAGELQKIA